MISQGEGERESELILDKEQNRFLINNDNKEETEDLNTGEWLNLSLGRNLLSTEGDTDSQSRPASGKVRSLSVQPHSLVHKPSRDETSLVARFNDANTRFSMRPFTLDDVMDSMWPGSFRLDSQVLEPQSEPCKLDLNLRL
ncbi:hypothetical protein GBA52_027610 [Prunus armeniaca]|nr:hypothetical protein GBA52_027610 [Prunus armeniaca]